jgi:hypothetical protein
MINNIDGIISFSKYFIENASQLSKELNIPVVYELLPNKCYGVFSAHDAAKELLDYQYRENISYIIYQSENIESIFFKNKYYIELLKRNKVLQYSPYTASKCKELYNINCDGYFNFSYETKPRITLFAVKKGGTFSEIKKDIDILFFGCITKKRYDILNEIQKRFTLNIVVTGDAFGEDLEKLLFRSHYIINISAYDNSVLETHRINKALALGCKVISNYSVDEKMNKKYKKYVVFCGRHLEDYILTIQTIFPNSFIR